MGASPEARCELIATGDELMSGAIADTNSAFACELLRSHGVAVGRITVVGDEKTAMLSVFRDAAARAAFVVVCGGLGPTEDDRTAAVAAELVGVPLERNEAALAQVRAAFERIGRPMSPNNEKQADLPAGCEILPNPRGTAPGFHVVADGTLFFFLPGVPHEYRRMLTEKVLPRIQAARRSDGDQTVHATRVLRLFGQGESRLASELGDTTLPEGVALGWRPTFPEIHLRLYAHGTEPEAVSAALAEAERRIREKLGRWMYGVDDETFSSVVGGLLRDAGQTLAVAESCTGGLLGSIITEVAGSSDYFQRGFITYANRAKTEDLGVPADMLAEHGAVSEPVARAMAEGARSRAGTDLACSITGVAGPAGGTEAKPVGTVFVALASEAGTTVRALSLWGDRAMIRTMSAYAALELVRRHLTAGP